MSIGSKIRNLRIQKNLTQEELAERTDLSKGYISQLEHDFSSPAMDTFFNILEVLGTTPAAFFKGQSDEQKVVYTKEEQTIYCDEEMGYQVNWLISESNEKEMEPILLSLDKQGEYKEFDPSEAETFVYILSGSVSLELGTERYAVGSGESLYFKAVANHKIKNTANGRSDILIVVTESYL